MNLGSIRPGRSFDSVGFYARTGPHGSARGQPGPCTRLVYNVLTALQRFTLFLAETKNTILLTNE